MAVTDEVVEEMRSLLVREMAHRAPGETVTRCLERAAGRLGIAFSRAQSYWWRKVRQVPAEEADLMRRRAQENQRQRLHDLQQELARLEDHLGGERSALPQAALAAHQGCLASRKTARS